ncbi:DUF883 family protein [Pseudomonas entomophila]|jgi:ElaB/YqjD/DUF883 family membrane-anchored ribosome-binding protein|uniref:DUF3618 domain-containing protein n=1 Tax=Pseudomonas entomophila TaxID=312306 RepID=UPI0015E4310F|nr:DUF3618 domain-containing protein [Pseudomonas entomophila]MBA1192890.1 DUF883 family protein [Pseudomonas entomophila]
MSPSFEHESHKNPDQLEQEINAKREHISHLVDAIEQRMTPGQLFDQALSYTKGNGGEFCHNLALTLKNNPLPTTLTAIGLGWLALNQNRPFNPGPASHGPGLGDKLGDMVDTVKGAFAQAGDKLHDAGDSVRAKAYDLRDKASGMSESTRHSAGDTADSLRRTAHDTTDSLRRTAHDARDQIKQQTDVVKGQFDTLLKEQPLVLAAIGIALGAAIGAALPSTRKEDQLMGSASDRLTDTVKAKGEQAYKQAKDTVTQTVAEQKTPETHEKSGTAQSVSSAATTQSSSTQAGTDLSSGLGFAPENDKP